MEKIISNFSAVALDRLTSIVSPMNVLAIALKAKGEPLFMIDKPFDINKVVGLRSEDISEKAFEVYVSTDEKYISLSCPAGFGSVRVVCDSNMNAEQREIFTCDAEDYIDAWTSECSKEQNKETELAFVSHCFSVMGKDYEEERRNIILGIAKSVLFSLPKDVVSDLAFDYDVQTYIEDCKEHYATD